MNTIVYEEFIESEGYWFNIEKTGSGMYCVVNTRRKKNMINRDDIPFAVRDFETYEEAKKYLETCIKGNAW